MTIDWEMTQKAMMSILQEQKGGITNESGNNKLKLAQQNYMDKNKLVLLKKKQAFLRKWNL